MSKTITGILEIAAGVALEIFPVLGPISEQVGFSLIAAGLTTTVESLIGTPRPPQSEGAIKLPIPPRVTAYGISRLYGAYILYETSASGVAVDVYAIHDGRIDGPLFFYLGDTDVARDRGVVGGTDDGAYSGNAVEIDYRLGLPTETAFSQVVGLIPAWTSDHRGDGVVTAMTTWQPVKSKDYLKIYPNGQPPLSMAARWSCVFDWRDTSQSLADPSTWKFSENWVLHLADYLLRFDNKTWGKHFAPTIAYWTAAADDAEVQVPITGFSTITTAADSPDGDHTLIVADTTGLYAGMSITISSVGSSGTIETLPVQSVNGPVITLAQEVVNAYPKGSGVSWRTSPDHPTYEPRYRSCVAFKHTDAHKDVIANLLACGDGWLSPRADGALVVYSGIYIAPTVAIGPDEIVSYSVQEGVDEENVINSIGVSYVSANHLYNTVDTDPWTDEDDIAARGKILSSTISPQTPSFSQNRRLAKRVMAKNNAPQRGTVTTNAAGRIVRGERYVMLLIIEAGTTFYSGPAEITKLTRNLQTGGVTFEWIAADPAIDDWNPAVEEGMPAPVGNRVAGEPLDAPVVTSVTPDANAVSGDSTGIRLIVAATGPDRSDLQWSTRWRVQGASVWNEQSFPDATGGSVTMETAFVPTQTAIEVQVVYVVGDGRVSPYSASAFASSTAPTMRGAYQVTAATSVPLSSDDTTISIAAFSASIDGTINGQKTVDLPAGTITGLTAGTKYAVFRTIAGDTRYDLQSEGGANLTEEDGTQFVNEADAGGSYFAVTTGAAQIQAMTSANNLFIGLQATSSSGTYPAGSPTPAGYGGDGSTYQGTTTTKTGQQV